MRQDLSRPKGENPTARQEDASRSVSKVPILPSDAGVDARLTATRAASASSSALDQWEALEFSAETQAEATHWLLSELRILGPADVAKRLIQLHERLRGALKEVERLRGAVSTDHRAASHASLEDSADNQPVEPQPLWRPAWDGFRRGFTLTYFARAGLGTTTRALQLLRQRRWQDLKGWNLLSEKGLAYREDAVRLGLFVGGFTALYSLIRTWLAEPCNDPADSRGCYIAGTAAVLPLAPTPVICCGSTVHQKSEAQSFTTGSAGLSLLFLDAERRRTLALYVAVRVAQCWHNSSKRRRQWWSSEGSGTHNHGDSLLFALATAQVMYAYVMRPETLPRGYWDFIVRTGPIHPTALEAVRHNIRGRPIDLAKVNSFIVGQGGQRLLSAAKPRQVPGWVLHPSTTSGFLYVWKAFAGSFKRTLPLYFSISVVPFAVLNFRRALKSPFLTVWHALAGSLRSTAFISTFVGLYMAAITVHRKTFEGDFKQLYWLAGIVASTSIFIEKKARRAELALYVLPRGIQSLFSTLLRRRLLPDLPLWEVVLFAACMGALMRYREKEPETMAPFVSTIIGRVVLGESSEHRPLPKGRPSLPASSAASPLISPREEGEPGLQSMRARWEQKPTLERDAQPASSLDAAKE